MYDKIMDKNKIKLSFPITFNNIVDEINRNKSISRVGDPSNDGPLPTSSGTPTRDSSAPVGASVDVATGDISKDFGGIAYSGEVIPQHGDISNLYIDVDTMEFYDQIPLLSGHTRGDEVGFAYPKVEDGQVKIDGTISNSATVPEGQRILELQKLGLEWRISVGIDPRDQQLYGPGMTFMVNGRQAQGPAYVIKNATLLEASIVSIPADRGSETKFSELNNINNNEVTMTSIKVNGIDSDVFTKDGKMFVAVEARELDTTKGYEFACECDGSKDKLKEVEKKFSDNDTELAKMKKENEALKKAIDDQRKADRFSKYTAAIEGSNTKFGEEDYSLFENLDDDAFDAAMEKFKADKKEDITEKKEEKAKKKIQMTTPNAELFESDAKEIEIVATPETPEQLNKIASDMVKEYKEKGHTDFTFGDALNIIRAKRA